MMWLCCCQVQAAQKGTELFSLLKALQLDNEFLVPIYFISICKYLLYREQTSSSTHWNYKLFVTTEDVNSIKFNSVLFLWYKITTKVKPVKSLDTQKCLERVPILWKTSCVVPVPKRTRSRTTSDPLLWLHTWWRRGRGSYITFAH